LGKAWVLGIRSDGFHAGGGKISNRLTRPSALILTHRIEKIKTFFQKYNGIPHRPEQKKRVLPQFRLILGQNRQFLAMKTVI
jgi:hypothetical protein